MSIKSNLGKRHESILSQTLGVDFVDYSYNASKSAKVSAETLSSKYQESTDNLGVATKENMLRIGSTDLTGNGTEKVKKKVRRSMLGQRTKLHNLDSALNINKNIPLITEEHCENNPDLTTNKEQAYNYLNTETPNEKYLKPLHSSSPHSGIRRQEKSVLETSKNYHQGAQTPPNPFECSESPTKFFETGIDDISAWSVFKTKLNGLKSPPASNEMDVKRSVTQLSKSSVKKNFKMKLFDSICENKIPNGRRNVDAESGSDPIKTREISKRPEQLDWSCHKQYNTRESSKQPIIEYSKSFAYDLENDYTRNSSNGNCIMKKEIHVSNVSRNTNKGEYTINNSDEDNDSLNDTIVAAVQKSGSKTPKLSVISEEEYNSENKHMETSLFNSASSGNSSDTKEETLSQESGNIKLELDQLNELCVTVQKHSNNIDKLLAELYKEKKEYNKHFSKLQESVKHLQTKCNTLSGNSFDKNIYVNSNSINKQRKKKRVISCKIKQSPALMLTPENTFASPFPSNKLSKKRKESFLNNYTELRKSFAYLQTPEHKSAKKTQFHNSVIYTPKSLSVCISEQMKRLDS